MKVLTRKTVCMNHKKDKKKLQARQETGTSIDANVYAAKVEKKAYELYEKKGWQDGHDQDDWFEAERIVEAEVISGK